MIGKNTIKKRSLGLMEKKYEVKFSDGRMYNQMVKESTLLEFYAP